MAADATVSTPTDAIATDGMSPTSSPAYGAKAVRGVVWIAFATAITKVGSFLAQLVLGWKLSDSEFGIYALAISAGSIASVFRDGGTRKILIQRGAEYETLARAVFQVSLLFNVFAAGLLVLASPLLEQFFNAPGLQPLLWVISASTVLSTFGTAQRSKLAIDMRFRTLALVGMTSALLRNLSSIVFALLGFGAMSFVLPLLLTALFEAICGWILVGRVPRAAPLRWPLFKELVGQSRWVMLGALAMSLILQGDYLAAGRIEDTKVLGVYFFAFQLTISVAALFTTGMESVLLPTMAKLKDDRVRQASAFLRTARVLVMAAAPCSIVLALVAPAMITLLWRGKWDAAIAPAQVQALSLVVCLLMPASVSLIESQGRWKLRSSLLLLDGLATVLFACIGAYLGGALSIAAWVSGGKVLATLMYCATGGYLLGLSARRVMAEAMPPILIAAAAAVGPVLLMRALPGHLVIGASTALLTFGLLFATGAWMLIPNYVVETLSILRRPTPNSK